MNQRSHKAKLFLLFSNQNAYFENKHTRRWLIYDPIDPAGQLIWLADTLHQAEANGEMVYIIQHISVGTVDCLQEYSRELWRILSR